MVTINLTKAKEIAKEKIRTERKSVLESLDTQFMRAIETGNTNLQVAISEQKQILRDITTNTLIVNASDANELKIGMETLIEQIKAQ